MNPGKCVHHTYPLATVTRGVQAQGWPSFIYPKSQGARQAESRTSTQQKGTHYSEIRSKPQPPTGGREMDLGR